MKCRLTKIKSNHNRVRTDVIEGDCEPPEVGFCFVLVSDSPIDEGADYRYIRTTPVREIKEEGKKIIFKTNNSEYSLEEI
jgi:hypothetical protein